jgi:chemotaxis protein methyltransferase CheR
MRDSPFSTPSQRGRTLAQAVVDTIREPLLVLDGNLRVIAASRAFCRTFRVSLDDTQGRSLHELGSGQWNVPALRQLLTDIIPRHTTIESFEVEYDFPEIGRRVMLLNAREVHHDDGDGPELLLMIDDVTERRAAEREKEELLREKELLLSELQHRVNNSLQIIASILLLKARTVQSEDTRRHLQDAHQRVLSLAAVQNHLHQARVAGDSIQIKPYLSTLCESLADSMIGDRQAITLEVHADGGSMTSAAAVSLGLITTELVINALKHAFPGRNVGRVVVGYKAVGDGWDLSVSDDGIGIRPGGRASGGLGTSIVEVLARQLGGRVEISTDPRGTTVAVAHSKAAPLGATA